MAKANPFRFSTKYQDDETDLLYYGYRYYNASTGRWNSQEGLRASYFGRNDRINADGYTASAGHSSGRRDPKGNPWPEPSIIQFPKGEPVDPAPNLPPNSPTMPATPATTTRQGFAGAPGICADLMVAAVNNRQYEDGIRFCREKVGSRGAGSNAVSWYFVGTVA